MSITCVFGAVCKFTIPKGLELLPVEENNKLSNFNKPFSWYIKNATLCYIDANSEFQQIVGDVQQLDCKFALDGSVEINEEDEEEEEDGDE
jgi:hypothetical protein